LEVLPKLEDESVDLIMTDPPYNKNKNYGVVSDKKPEKDFWKFNRLWIDRCNRILKDGHHFYFSCSHEQIFKFKEIGEAEGFKFRRLLIWATNECRGHMNKRTWLASYEPILWFQKREGKYSYGLFNAYPYPALDVFIVRSPHKNSKEDKKYHPTQKPTRVMENIIAKSSQINDVVLDPFMGSGTTMEACQNLGRSCIGIEINPEYCEIIKKRCFGKQFLDREVEYKFEVIE